MTGAPVLERPIPRAPEPPQQRTQLPISYWALALASIVIIGVLALSVVLIFGSEDASVEPVPADPVPAEPAKPEPAEPADDPVVEPAAPQYREELRANWIVVGIAAGDELNVRSGPGRDFKVIAGLTLTSPELESTGRIADVGTQLWREIVVPGDGTGWVNARYLGEIPAPQVDVRYREELRANWDVTGVVADDVLNVRSGPGVANDVVATLPPDTAELESTGRIADVGPALWREIVVPGDGTGWVNAAFLTETG